MKISNSKLKLLIKFYMIFIDNIDDIYMTSDENQIILQFEEFLLTLLRERIAKNTKLEQEILKRRHHG